jgi:hypothetical protein
MCQNFLQNVTILQNEKALFRYRVQVPFHTIPGAEHKIQAKYNPQDLIGKLCDGASDLILNPIGSIIHIFWNVG